jgi:hypothetical protein
MEALAASLRATQEALSDCLDVAAAKRNASHVDPALPHPALRAVAEVALVLETSRDRLVQSLAALPGGDDYAPYAERLRQAAEANPTLKELLRQSPKLSTPLGEAVRELRQIAEDLRSGRERLLEAGRGLRLATLPVARAAEADAAPASLAPQLEAAIARLHEMMAAVAPMGQALQSLPRPEEWARVTTPMVELANAMPVLAQSVAKLETLAPALAESARTLSSPLQTPALKAVSAEAEAITASLRAVGDLATPLVDALSDLAQEAMPLTERLRGLAVPRPEPGAEPGVAPAPVSGSSDDVADWAADILRAVRELSQSVKHGAASTPEQGKKLWDSIRQIQVEVVNLQGALLAPSKKLPHL